MPRLGFTFVLTLAFTLMSGTAAPGWVWAENGMGRGGGDEYALEFAAEGTRISDLLDAWDKVSPLPLGIDPREFRLAVRTTGFKRVPRAFIELVGCAYHPEVAQLPECQAAGKPGQGLRKKHRIEVSAVNISAERMIEISEARWPGVRADADLKTAVVLHEYLGILRKLDRYYDVSVGFFERLKSERDLAGFREAFKTKLQTGVAAMIELFTPSLDQAKLTFGTIQTTTDYERCIRNPGGLNEKIRTEHCVAVAQSLQQIAAGIDFTRTDDYQKSFVRERAAEKSLNDWIDQLSIETRRKYALQQEYRVYGRANELRASVQKFQGDLVAELRQSCPGRVWQYLGCAFPMVREIAERRLPERLRQAREELQAEADRSLADITRYSDAFSQ